MFELTIVATPFIILAGGLWLYLYYHTTLFDVISEYLKKV